MKAQHKTLYTTDYEGIWQNQDYKKNYKIVRGDSLLSIICNVESGYFRKYIELYGFIKKDYDDNDPIKNQGTKKDDLFLFGNDYEIYEMSENYIEVYNQNVFGFDRVKTLPQIIITKLYQHSQKDSRNYISEFLELDVRAVKSKIADVFSKPRYVVNRLPQGTVVRVLGVEQKGGLVPVEYYTDDTKVDTALMTASFLEKPLHVTQPLVEASFSCEGIYGGVEEIICSDVHLGLLDQWLGTYYKQAKFLKPKALKKSQRAWLKERNKVLKIKDPYEQKSTLQHLYQERIQFLDNWRG